MKKYRLLAMLIVLLLVSTGCNLFSGRPQTQNGGQIVVVPTDSAPAVLLTPTPSPEPTPEPTPTPSPEPTPTAAPASQEELLLAYVQRMSTEEKIGQLLMFGFSGTGGVSSAFLEIMHTYHIGNVILYGPNIVRANSDGGFSQCAALTADLNRNNDSGIPLLISTDVEGGNVTRFKWPNWPTHAATLGASGDTERAREQFAYIANGLVSVGINTDLAPVMDVARNPSETFLGKRIISADADVAADIGAACIEGLHESGCLAIVKHFPGHGATTEDTHATTPVVEKTLDELSYYELVPFAAAVNAGADGVMVAHISYPNIDPDNIASMSSVLITDVLRGQLGFTGVVMSDDFRMAGLRSRYTHERAAVQFILSGGDLILCGANHDYQRSILAGLYAAVADGTITEERLNQSVVRILTAKMRVTDWTPQL